jgi:hypothetical protein
MSVILNQITVGDTIVATLDVNPVTSGGANLPQGSIGTTLDASGIFYKFGPLVTDWNNSSNTLTGSANLNFPITLPQTSSELTIAVSGATPGNVVSLGLPAGIIPPNCTYIAYVSVGNTVTVRFNNYSAIDIDPGPGVFRVVVFK